MAAEIVAAGPATVASRDQPTQPGIKPGTFTSVLPLVDDLLASLGNLAESERGVTPVEAGEAVAGKARELFAELERMKQSALALPGGHLDTDRLRELTRAMEHEAAERRALLRRIQHVPMPTADRLGQGKGHGQGATALGNGTMTTVPPTPLDPV